MAGARDRLWKVRWIILREYNLIEWQLQALYDFKNDGRIPSQRLLDDIEGYKWLLAGDDNLRRSYFEEKRKVRESGGLTKDLTVRVICRKLGWEN